MKDQKIAIEINKPIKDVFAFTINPENTPKWIDAIVTEQTNEWPPKLGTIYRSQNAVGEWRELEMTTFEQNSMFVLSDKNGFHIKYKFIPLNTQTTKLDFYLWTDSGELKNFFTMDILENLKREIEEQDL